MKVAVCVITDRFVKLIIIIILIIAEPTLSVCLSERDRELELEL